MKLTALVKRFVALAAISAWAYLGNAWAGADHPGGDQAWTLCHCEDGHGGGSDHGDHSADGNHESHHPSYVCPMHPEVVSDQAGKCPICGMNLVKMENGNDETGNQAGDHDHH